MNQKVVHVSEEIGLHLVDEINHRIKREFNHGWEVKDLLIERCSKTFHFEAFIVFELSKKIKRKESKHVAS